MYPKFDCQYHHFVHFPIFFHIFLIFFHIFPCLQTPNSPKNIESLGRRRKTAWRSPRCRRSGMGCVQSSGTSPKKKENSSGSSANLLRIIVSTAFLCIDIYMSITTSYTKNARHVYYIYNYIYIHILHQDRYLIKSENGELQDLQTAALWVGTGTSNPKKRQGFGHWCPVAMVFFSKG